jgi:CHAT domain-containing protein
MLFLLMGLIFGQAAAQAPIGLDPQFVAQRERAKKLMQAGKIEDSRREFASLLQMNKPGSRDHDDWEIYGNLRVAECCAILGKYEDAERQLEPIAIKYPAPHPLAVLIYKDIGNYQLLLWKMDKAEHNLEAAVTQSKRANDKYKLWGTVSSIHPFQLAQTRSLLGRAHMQNNNNSKAETVFKELEAILDSEAFRKIKIEKSPEYLILHADCVNGLAEMDWRKDLAAGSILKRAEILRELKTNLTNVRVPERKFELIGKTIMVSRFLANCYMQIHYYDDASVVLNDAEAMLPKLQNDRNQRWLRGQLNDQKAQVKIAEISYKSHDAVDLDALLLDINEAHEIADRARADYRAISGETAAVDPELVTANANLSSALALINKVRGELLERMSRRPESQMAYGEAMSHADAAIDGFSGRLRAEHDVLTKLRGLRAWLLWKRGISDEAHSEGTAALQTAEKNHTEKDWVGFGPFYSTLLCIEYAAERLDSAGQYAERHRRLMSQSLLKLAAQMTPAQQVSFFREYDEEGFQLSLLLGSREEFWRQSAEWLVNGKAKGIEAFAEATRRGTGNTKMRNVVARQSYNLYGAQQFDRVGMLETEKEKRAIAQDSAREGKVTAAEWLDLKALPLEDDEVYVDIVALREMPGGPSDYFAWVVVNPGDVRVVKLGDAAEIEKLVSQVINRMGFDGGESGWIASEQNLKQKFLMRLSELLLRPIEMIAGSRSKWIVSPDGPLWSLPWSMLLTDDGEYAVEKIVFRYVASGRDIYQRKSEGTELGPLLIVADPDFEVVPKGVALGTIRRTDQGNLKPYPRAEGTEAQGNELAKLFPGVAPLTRDRATKAALFEMKAAPRILYLATHGFFKEPASGVVEDPFLCSGIALAGFNTVPKEKGRQELPGVLTAAEVLCAPVKGTELVVLSSCQTSMGKAVYSHSSTSMRHAFHLAGARSVVASLWVVDAEKTKELMVGFMHEVASGADKAISLQKAQSSMIQRLRQDEQHAHPAWWAAFTLSGF